MLALQGLPPDFFDEHSPFRKDAQRKMVGNGVPQAMGLALARAIARVTDAQIRCVICGMPIERQLHGGDRKKVCSSRCQKRLSRATL